ncbi:Rab6 GTPase activator GAPCenA, TBC domain protein [Trachipleistophora hominis]|uniref:Rab6 GTPase activator GAPCenA, TBC domain protein n=1 Tax=Trachipleistophora hominis TaxID=72359 RepID=L7JT36_TRAHO|nr:Rab6 GTPase activator GAPCenA, TBC domain protein [Trachipleistophora hominis]
MAKSSAKENENSQARLLYQFPKSTTRNLFTDTFGFITKEKETVSSMHSVFKLKHRWERILTEEKAECMDGMVFKGVPLFLKNRVWTYMLRSRKKYQEVSWEEYTRLRDEYSGFEYQIHVDIQRTFRNHALFYDAFGEGQCKLFRVLVAYANYNPHIGYCQGMASFTSLILMYFDELEAFNVLINILSTLNALFDAQLSLLPTLMSVQKEVFILVIPEVYYLLKNENVDLCLFVYSWYLTLFSRFDIKLSLRIWDIFIFYGTASLLAVSCAILSFYVRRLGEMHGESLVAFLSSLDGIVLGESDVDSIIEKVKGVMEEIDLDDINNMLELQ